MTDPDLRDPRLDSAYRDTPRDEPPPELDERIRAAARRAVRAGPQSLEERTAAARGRSFVVRWRVPLSLAATVVLVVSLALLVQEAVQRSQYDGAGPVSAPSPAPAVAPSAPPAANETDVPREAAPPASPKPADRVRAAPAQRKMGEAAPSTGTPPAPGPIELRQERTSGPAPQPLGVPADAASAPAPTPAIPGGAMRIAPQAAPSPAVTPPRGADSASGAVAAPPPASALPMQLAPRPAPSPDAAPPLSRDRELSDRPARAAREAAPAAMPPRSPEEWLEAIRRLTAEGRTAEAAAELAAFRRRYPDYSLPPDLAR